MILRVVKMEIREEALDSFLVVFEASKAKIRAFEGCVHLQLWQDKENPSTVFTYSHWQSEKDLEAYRHSELFKATWATTKVLFKEKAQAWSLDRTYMLK